MSSDDTGRPKRDVSARNAVGRCNHCGGHANSTLGGEHIWKCSEIIPKAAIRQLAEKWRNETEEKEYRHHCADDLEELISSHDLESDR